MATGELLLLGAIAGLTIFLGLPFGRLQDPAPRLKAFLNATATGILVFLLWDVLSGAWEPVTHALDTAKAGTTTWGHFAGLSATFALCLGVGTVSLVYYDRFMAKRARRDGLADEVWEGPPAGGRGGRPDDAVRFGPGAAALEEFAAASRVVRTLSEPRRLALLIAVGIGLHNFAEGLAIGQSAARGEVSLAVLLIVGFGLHNATEGFGIVAPLTAEAEPPSWAFLAAMGLIGGGPTFFGTLLGQSVVNNAVAIAFLALAAGSILYVVVQLLKVAFKMGYQELLMWGLLTGVLAGFATDMIVRAAGV
jgi:ZIP family zinc transporter